MNQMLSQKFVIPAKAGIQCFKTIGNS